jgi:hypothetical protein
MEAMLKHRSHSVEFKRQVAQEFLAGETLHRLAKRHDVSRNRRGSRPLPQIERCWSVSWSDPAAIAVR